jgi:hypothetical protein
MPFGKARIMWIPIDTHNGTMHVLHIQDVLLFAVVVAIASLSSLCRRRRRRRRRRCTKSITLHTSSLIAEHPSCYSRWIVALLH